MNKYTILKFCSYLFFALPDLLNSIAIFQNNTEVNTEVVGNTALPLVCSLLTLTLTRYAY